MLENGQRIKNSKLLCPKQLCCTSEDECKWFYCHVIYSPETNNKVVRYRIQCHGILLLFTYNGNYLVITYSVHDRSFLSRRTLLPVFLVAPWECCHLLCCWLTAYLAPRLEGQALPHFPLPGWPHFPQGPGTYQLPRRLPLLLPVTEVK
jgi:hypothetical protein